MVYQTTTLLELAKCAFQQGHRQVTYLTYNKSAAEDAKMRIASFMADNFSSNMDFVPILESSTIHACAMRLRRRSREQEEKSRIWDDERMQGYIEVQLRYEILDFLRPCLGVLERDAHGKSNEGLERMRRDATKQVVFFVFKTLVNFCRSKMTLEDLKNTRTFGRVYYPGTLREMNITFGLSFVLMISYMNLLLWEKAVLYHRNPQNIRHGFDRQTYDDARVSFYADVVANKLWRMLEEEEVISYDLEVKRAQLADLQIAGSLLLVDESQDMDACQINWMAGQSKFGTHVYLVGDCAQSIYGFRGAKSKCLMDISNEHSVRDCTLTTSWRFGHEIARVANLILFCKERSPQTSQNPYKMTWRPYRVQGGSPRAGTVTGRKLDWKEQKFTLIAYKNATLMKEALLTMGYEMSDDIEDQEGDNGVDTLEMPKFFVNGKGSSGARKFRDMFKTIQHLFELYTAEPSSSVALPRKDFPEFNGEMITWTYFFETCTNRGLDKYATLISVVLQFKEKTMEAVRIFEEQVLEKKYSADEADVILSTCHAAKGMEWDNVQVCQDFVELRVNESGPQVVDGDLAQGNFSSPRGVASPFREQQMRRTSWQMKFKDFGDDVNLLYVACTRAKKILSVPESIVQYLKGCDSIHLWRQAYQKDNGGMPEQQRRVALHKLSVWDGRTDLSASDFTHIYRDIVDPLRKEQKLDESELLLKNLLDDGQDEKKQCKSEEEFSENGNDELENNFEFCEDQKMAEIPIPIIAYSCEGEKDAITNERECTKNGNIEYHSGMDETISRSNLSKYGRNDILVSTVKRRLNFDNEDSSKGSDCIMQKKNRVPESQESEADSS